MTTNTKQAREILEQLYLERSETGDITFLVESVKIPAHRWVLAAASPKFKAQFYGLRADSDVIEMPNVSAAAFNEFLQFFYKEKIELRIENIEAVLNLAKQSLVDEFINNCINFLIRIMIPQNVCWIYLFAIMYDIDKLRVECEEQISKNTSEIFRTDEFFRCNHDVLLRILTIDTFNCSEIDVFNACIEWARANCKQKNLDQEKTEHLRTTLGDAVYQIRFSSMLAKDFAALHKSLSDFFGADEIIEILYITSKLDGFQSKKFCQKSRIRADCDSDDESMTGSDYSLNYDNIYEWMA